MKNNFAITAANNNNKPVALGLALQGGGSYGAFTKGALKALLESGLITGGGVEIKAITGTSAGAMNGLMVTHGLNSGGPQQAIKNLDALWDDTGRPMRTLKTISPVFRAVAFMTWPNLPESVMQFSFAMMPNGYVAGQLKKTLEKNVPDWDAVQNGPVKLFINAVRVDPETQERSQRIFTGKELTPDAFAAAGSLEALGPYKIDGVDYYDGGYWRNPCFDDIEKEPISDLMIITIMETPDHPITATSQDDLRARHAKPGCEVMKSELYHHLEWMNENKKDLNLHVISLAVDKRWDDTSRMNTDPRWIAELELKGYEAAQQWLESHADKLGKQSSYKSACAKQAEPALQFAM